MRTPWLCAEPEHGRALKHSSEKKRARLFEAASRRAAKTPPCVTKYGENSRLFDGDGFGEVAGLVHVAAAADGDVVGKKLERNDFEDRREELWRGRELDDVIGGGTGEMVTRSDHSYDDAVARADFLHDGNTLFIERDARGIGGIARGQDYDREIFVDESVRAVLHFPSGIVFGVKNCFHFVRNASEFLQELLGGVAGKRSARFTEVHGE